MLKYRFAYFRSTFGHNTQLANSISCKYRNKFSFLSIEKCSQIRTHSSANKIAMDRRLNLGNDVREVKLGSTFNSPKPRTSFHTLKYDFKPASIDLSKTATLDVSSNNQVTVTMPHLDSSGVPKTVFKGNQRNYTKECVLIIDKVTGEITLEKLHHNIQVKKTRSETNNKSSSNFSSMHNAPQHSLQSHLQPQPHSNPHLQAQIQQSSQIQSQSQAQLSANAAGTSNSNNNININPNTNTNNTNSKPKMLENNTQRVSNKTRVSTGIRKNAIGPFVQRHSPIQGSPSYPHHRSPQQAPAWNANNGQSTLPSIPLIGLDDDFAPLTNGSQEFSMSTTSSTNSPKHHHHKPSTSSPKLNQPQPPPPPPPPMNPSQSMQSSHNNGINRNHLNVGMNMNNNPVKLPPPSIHHQHLHHQMKDESSEIGVLSSSDSSDSSDSDSNSSDSDSDSDDEPEDRPPPIQQQQPAPISNGSNPFPNVLLSQDLHLSSNSSDSDDD